jgi:hypothetical protein
LTALDRKDHINRLIDAAHTEFFTKGQRWFLLHRLFGMSLTAIAELDGASVVNVKHAVQEVEDRMLAGEKGGDFLLPAVSGGLAEEARGRLESKRARRRDEHARRLAKKEVQGVTHHAVQN